MSESLTRRLKLYVLNLLVPSFFLTALRLSQPIDKQLYMKHVTAQFSNCHNFADVSEMIDKEGVTAIGRSVKN